MDSITPQNWTCGCVEFYLKWRVPEGMVGYRHLEKDCGNSPAP